MTTKRMFMLTLLVICGLAATAQATHTENLILTADCDGFTVEADLYLASDFLSGELFYTVEAVLDGTVVATSAGSLLIERDGAVYPLAFSDQFDVEPAGATEAVFTFTMDYPGYYDLDETHLLPMECIVDDCQVRRPVYFYRNPDAWPVEELTIGGQTLNKCQIRHLMVGCWRYTVTKRLFRHTVAAMLNDIICGGAPQDIIADANTFLANHPRRACLSGVERREARVLKNLLREFNARDSHNKAAESDPEWDESVEPTTWGDVKALF